jgi:hypothetical protein
VEPGEGWIDEEHEEKKIEYVRRGLPDVELAAALTHEQK